MEIKNTLRCIVFGYLLFPACNAKEGKGGKRRVFSHMRNNGIEDISEIKVSYLEIYGQISFIQKK